MFTLTWQCNICKACYDVVEIEAPPTECKNCQKKERITYNPGTVVSGKRLLSRVPDQRKWNVQCIYCLYEFQTWTANLKHTKSCGCLSSSSTLEVTATQPTRVQCRCKKCGTQLWFDYEQNKDKPITCQIGCKK